MESLEASRHGHKAAHAYEHLLKRPTEKNRHAVDCRKVVGVEPARETHLHLTAVEQHERAVEARLEHTATEVGVCAERICVDLGFCVLHHIHPGLVIGVCQGECVGGEHVEEGFLGIHIVFHRAVVVEVISCEIGEYASGET